MKLMSRFLTSVLLLANIANADAPATHGMLLFGDKVTYASHLPMFHAPHDYQVILKLEIMDHPRSQTLKAYEQEKKKGSTLFTLVPEVMDLTKVMDGSKTAFNALIYDGHFERGGKRLGGVIVKVSSIVYAAKLDGEQSPSDEESYFVFGDSGEYFGVHVIKSKPSFDTVLMLSQPHKIYQQSCRSRDCPHDPIEVPISDSQLPLTLISNPMPFPNILGSPLFGIHAHIKQTLYFEQDELSH